MAYAFDQLQNIVNQNQQDAGNTNIFAPTTSSTSGIQTPGASPGTQGTTTGQVKTDASADLGNAGQGSAVSGQSASSSSPNSFQSSRPDLAAYGANAGKTTAPQAFQDIQNQIASQQSNLQNAANQYVQQGQNAQQYGVSNDTLNQAISGNQGSLSSVRNLLNQTNPNAVNAFIAPDTTVRDTGLLSTDAGLKQLVSRGQSPTYTPGMQSFDMAMLRSAPGFSNLIQQIQGNYGNLQSQAQNYANTLPQQITDYGKTQLASAQGVTKNSLQDYANRIQQNEQAAADEANRNLEQFKQTGAQALEQQALQGTQQQLAKDIQAASPRSSQFVGAATLDPSKYINFANPYNSQQFVSNDQANQFNNIMNLLGQGQSQRAASPNGPLATINQNAMYNDLAGQVQAARASQDAVDRAQQGQILKAASDYANNLNAQRLSGVGDKNQLLLNLAASGQKGIDSSLTPYLTPNTIDINKYVQFAPNNLSTNDVLTQEQANQLNALNSDLGLQQSPYAPGNANLTASPYSFDQSGYTSALVQALQNQRNNIAADNSQLQSAHNTMINPSAPGNPILGQLQIPSANDPLNQQVYIPLTPTPQQFSAEPQQQQATKPGQLIINTFGLG